ncbi:hypothetical protein lerEdw1_010640 [Lerista edwardsae]|nr:hypothetical protein lerEdw1_010640 [Lerista edwardsae]
MGPLRLWAVLLFGLISAQKTPRLKLVLKDAPVLKLGKQEKLTAMFHEPGSDRVYLGGQGMLKVVTFADSKAAPAQLHIPLKVEDKAQNDCKRKSGAVQANCDNFIRVIQRVDRSIYVCGTNAGSPKCWIMANETALKKDAQGHAVTASGDTISPASPSERAVTVVLEDKVYSAFSGSKATILKSYGRKRVKTDDRWLANTEFVGAAPLLSKDSSKDEVYFFYNDINRTAGLDDKVYKAHLGRVCKVDDGGKPPVMDAWSTFLKVRLVCGHPKDPQRFHRLQDAFVIQEGRKSEGTLYGIFSNAWGTSAVCAYNMTRISNLFKTSKFKGFSGTVPQPWPGTCILTNNPNVPPRTTLSVIQNYPEIDTVIYPDEGLPLYVLQNNDTYTRLAVDRVQDAANVSRDILFLGTEKGKIHKVLPSREQTVIIAELSPFTNEAPVSSMLVDPTKGHLYASTESEVAYLPLADCDQYTENCWKCVLSRDPYCGWDPDSKTCTAVSQDGNRNSSNFLQSLDSQNTDICQGAEDKPGQEALKKVSVDPTSYIYLPCPLRSHHAIYTWVKDGKTYPCSMDGQSCTLRFGESTPMDHGVFKCTATEEGYKEEITAFKVTLNGGRIPEVSLVAVAVGVMFLSITILLL